MDGTHQKFRSMNQTKIYAWLIKYVKLAKYSKTEEIWVNTTTADAPAPFVNKWSAAMPLTVNNGSITLVMKNGLFYLYSVNVCGSLLSQIDKMVAMLLIQQTLHRLTERRFGLMRRKDFNDPCHGWNMRVYFIISMLCTPQLGGHGLKAFGRVQYTPFQLADKSPMITEQHTAGGSVSQLSQLTKL